MLMIERADKVSARSKGCQKVYGINTYCPALLQRIAHILFKTDLSTDARDDLVPSGLPHNSVGDWLALSENTLKSKFSYNSR